jgi:transcription antitermination factor NusG
MLKWIVVRSKPRSEKIASNGLTNKGIEVFLPIIKKRRQWSDRKKWVEFPLFSGYLFARIELKNSIYVLNAHGVNTIVKFGDKIVTIDDDVINSIKLALEGGYDLLPMKYYFSVGDQVKVIGGPMEGAIGIVDAKHKKNDRLVIKIDALEQAIAVNIETQLLEYIN